MTSVNFHYKKKINKGFSVLNISLLVYGKGDELVLLNMGGSLDLVHLNGGYTEIKLPEGWVAKKTHINNLPEIYDSNNNIIWDSPLLENMPEWGKNQDWLVYADILGKNLSVNGTPVDGYIMMSYKLQQTLVPYKGKKYDCKSTAW